MKFILPMMATAILVTGCKVKMETEVSLSDLLESQSKAINGDVFVEVPTCNSYEDSRKPSSSVVEAQQSIPSVLADAEYVECFSKNFDSFAHFSIPVVLDKDPDGKFASGFHINIASDSELLLIVGIPQAIKTNMERVQSNSFGANSIDLEMNIIVHNDTGKDFSFDVLSAFIDGQPHVYSGPLTARNNSSFVLTLSDVSVSRALEFGTANVLLH